jgi:hypothetical protein
MSSEFLNAPTPPATGWRFHELPAETPIRALPLAPTPATAAHDAEAAQLISDAMQNGGRLNLVVLVAAVAHALALRDEAAASLDASNQVIIAGMTGVIRGMEDTISSLRQVAGLPDLEGQR